MRRLEYLFTVVLAGLLAFVPLALEAAVDQPGAHDGAQDLLYVTNQGEASVAVIDMETFEVVETVDLTALGFSERALPHHVIAEPDGSAWYVSLIGEGVVLKFDRDNTLVGQAQMEVPGLLALHPTEDLLFVARSMSAVNAPSSVGMVERSTMEVIDEVDVFFSRPHAMAVTRDGRFAYSASLATNQLMGVDVETLRGEITTLPGQTQVIIQLAASPVSSEVVATGQLTGQLLVFDRDERGVLSVRDTVQVGHQPWHPTYSPRGDVIYVPNKQSNSVSVVDVATRQVIETIEHESFAQPHGTALSSDGRYLFISNNNQRGMMEMMARDMMSGAEAPPREHDGHGTHGDHEQHDMDDDNGHGLQDATGTVSVVDTETWDVVRVIEVGTYPTGMGTRAWR